MRRWLNRAGGVLLLLLALLVAWLGYAQATTLMHPGMPSIAHAGGRIGGQDYTNSIEAFSAAYGRGHRLIEVDFETTADGVYVCGHDWRGFDAVPSFETFEEARLSTPFPPCTVPELLDWLDRRPDASLVTDAKTDVLSLNSKLGSVLGERLVGQAYSVEDAKRMGEAGISRIVLTLYLSGNRAERMRTIDALAASGMSVDALTIPAIDALTGVALYAKGKLDVPVLTHTINDCWTVALVHALGVDAVYTDDLNPRDCRLTPLS